MNRYVNLSTTEIAAIDEVIDETFEKRRGHTGEPVTYRQLDKFSLKRVLAETVRRAKVVPHKGYESKQRQRNE